MTSAALTDLQNRINSNTLTAAQQAALSAALTVINPVFPSPDESSAIVDNLEEPAAREWMATLYTIQAEFGGAGGAVLPTNQTVWHVNAATGNNANSGLTAGTAIQSFAYLASLWKGTAGGGRPQLSPSVGTTITIFVDSLMPNTDPVAPLLDVDLAPGMTLLFEGQTNIVPNVTSILTTASTFARTSAGGKQTFTDATVANFATPLLAGALLMQDTTAPRGSVAWLVGPDPGPSATGTSTVFYTPATPGVLATPTIVQPLAADGYTLSTLTTLNLGNGFKTRMFPQNGQAGGVLTSAVFFYRLHFALPGSSDVVTFGGSPGVVYAFQECQRDIPIVAAAQGAVLSFNCLDFHSTGGIAQAGGTLEYFAGGASNGTNAGGPNITAEQGGVCVADLDFALIAMAGNFFAQGGLIELGNVSHWGTSAGGQIIVATDGGEVVLNPLLQATSVAYGTDGGTFCSIGAGTSFGPGKCTYSQTGSGTPCADQFKSTNVAFLLGRGPSTSAWGTSTTTGLAVGSTTCTIAHMDAAIGAGTGFGSNAVDPATMSYFGVAA